jgi:hypothetical protein
MAQAIPIRFSSNLRSLELTISDTLLVDSISINLIKVERPLPVTLVMSGIGKLIEACGPLFFFRLPTQV